MIARRRHSLAALLTILLPCIAHPAAAQVNTSLGLDSDYRLRGISLSDGRAALSASLGYDHPSGLYLGASVVGQPGARLLSYGEYLGYASRATMAVSWDVGVADQAIAGYANHSAALHYTEVYVGLQTGHIGAHVYYAPDYLRAGARTLYVDLSGAVRPWRNWRVLSHLGALTSLSGGPNGQGPSRQHYDVQAGVARQFTTFEVHLSWTGAAPAQPRSASQNPSGLVLGAAYFF